MLASALINVLMMMAKVECYLGEKNIKDKTFEYRNKMTSLFVVLAGIQYSLYMGRMLFVDAKIYDYGLFVAVIIALVSFVEITFAIIGCFKVNGKGHYYRNIKIVNLCSAITAIVVTFVALITVAGQNDPRIPSGIFGLCVGILIVLFGLFILVAPKISLVDNEHNVYIGSKNFSEKELLIPLTNSKFYANYIYEAKVSNGVADGHIIRLKSPIFKWNIYIKILVIILSEILIFPYAIGAFVFYFKNRKLIKKLDEKTDQLGFKKI